MRQYLDLTSWILLFFFAPFTVLILLSQNSIPGDFFYPVKRGLESIILVAASVNPSTKVAFRTDLTGRRFKEAQQLLVSKADTTAFSDFVSEVQSTQRELSTVSNSQDKIQSAEKIIAKIEEYQTQLTQTQNQVQTAQSLPQQLQNQPPTSSTPVGQAHPSQGGELPSVRSSPTASSAPNAPVQTSHPNEAVQPTPVSTAGPVITLPVPTSPPLAPSVTNTIANNPQKAEEVKSKISDTKKDLEKIKEKVKKEKEDAEVQQKIKKDQEKLKEQIKKQEGENKEKRNEPAPTPHK